MIELQKIVDISQKDKLISKLQQAGFAFAAWQMPGTLNTQLIISLQNAKKLDQFQFADLDTGFLINKFEDNHPVKPFFISADIIIRNEEVSINSRIRALELDQFRKEIEGQGSTYSKSESSDNSIDGYFEPAVDSAVEHIKEGLFEKVVLSRYKDEELPAGFSAWNFFQTICNKYSNAFASMSFIPGKGLWIGATPELLLSDNNERFKTVALAGTKTLDESQNLSEIAWIQKEIEEQAFVSRYIINCFKKIRLREFHEHGPKTIQAGSLVHLKTEFIVDYSELAFDNLADQMLELLHPTSAVCGMPIEQTRPWIKQIEKYNREFYSGFLGPVNFEKSTDLFVNLRCMKVEHNKARFFAGAGITEGSVPQKEFEETEMKINVLKTNFNPWCITK